jgi:hypothetical protein
MPCMEVWALDKAVFMCQALNVAGISELAQERLRHPSEEVALFPRGQQH